MTEYWEERYNFEGKIWGDLPSKSAIYARDLFLKNHGKTVLIPGSGYGRNAECFASAGFKVTGIEISRTAIEIARQQNSNATYYHGSVLEMPFDEILYDTIYCFNVLHLFRENERRLFIKKCANQLKDNGWLFFTVFSEEESSFGKGNSIEPNTFESKPGRPVHYFTDSDLKAHFHNFKLIETGLMEDPEIHGAEGHHTHIIRYILVQKKSVFEFDGEKYKSASKHQKEWGSKIIAGLNLSGNESILDLGCGDGILTAQLAALVPKGKVIGIDASQGMIATAKQLEKENLTFQLSDIKELNFANEFDLIFSNATLHWVNDHSQLLMNCFNALKKGGRIRFNFAGDGNCRSFYKVVREVMKENKYSINFSNFEWPWYMPKLPDYKELVNHYNYSEIEIWEEEADRYFPRAEDLIKWIDQPSIVPFLKEIPPDSKQNFRDTVVNKMLNETKQTDGTYFETFRRINVHAKK